MLRGSLPLLDAVHGEPIFILSGADQGKTFTGRIIFEADFVLDDDLSRDNRGRRKLSFSDGMPTPRIRAVGEQIQQANGKKWRVVANPRSDYLDTDFELQELIPGKDQP